MLNFCDPVDHLMQTGFPATILIACHSIPLGFTHLGRYLKWGLAYALVNKSYSSKAMAVLQQLVTVIAIHTLDLKLLS